MGVPRASDGLRANAASAGCGSPRSVEVRVMVDITSLVEELQQEADVTRRLLERVPSDRLTWRPHPKSMTLGALALHVAEIPGQFAGHLAEDGVDFTTVDFGGSGSVGEGQILPALDESVATASRWLAQLDTARATGLYHARVGSRELFAAPRIALVRSLMFNHWYHHRGELCVYLRLLGVRLPPIYGPTADENPFAAPPTAGAAPPPLDTGERAP
jgi:uncharacterized damage-inducible protein DinB